MSGEPITENPQSKDSIAYPAPEGVDLSKIRADALAASADPKISPFVREEVQSKIVTPEISSPNTTPAVESIPQPNTMTSPLTSENVAASEQPTPIIAPITLSPLSKENIIATGSVPQQPTILTTEPTAESIATVPSSQIAETAKSTLPPTFEELQKGIDAIRAGRAAAQPKPPTPEELRQQVEASRTQRTERTPQPLVAVGQGMGTQKAANYWNSGK